MGLDLYAGTLTRYYAHNWKSVVQQWAEENGYSFNRITPEGECAEEELSPAEIQENVEGWRDQILAAVTRPGREPYIPWPEDNERPYYTDKPDWDAFGAMLLVAACCSCGEPIPASVPKNWDFTEHPLIRRMSEDPENIWSLFRDAVCWLPLPASFLFQAPLPTGNQETISTTAGLRLELERLNELAWQADEDTIRGWRQSEGYPEDVTVSSGGIFSQTAVQEQEMYDTQSLARFSFSVFYQALQFAEENRTPLLRDY